MSEIPKIAPSSAVYTEGVRPIVKQVSMEEPLRGFVWNGNYLGLGQELTPGEQVQIRRAEDNIRLHRS